MKPTERARLTTALRDQVAKIAADLRGKMRAPGPTRERAQRLHVDEQVAEDFDVWTDLLSRRAAVLWVLKSVYLRVLEDRGLLSPGRLLDPEAQQLFERLAPHLGETAFLRWVYRDLASARGGLPELFSPQPAEVALPSDELSRALIRLWRERDADTGATWSFADEHFEGELMGDLYQELDPVVKDRFALCQTPDFVRGFILDRTLTPAIETFGADEVRLLDPACGSGHFLIDGLKRIVAATAAKHLDWEREVVVKHALDRVVGIDLNDYACGLARARLVMTAAELAGKGTLAEAARFHPHVYWADGLEQVERDEVKQPLQTDLFVKTEEKPRATLTRADVRTALRKVFVKKFHAVVANPPYIVESDDARKAYHREKVGREQRYVSAHGQYHLSSPFTERCFQLAMNGGFVGLLVDNQFMKKDYGRPLVEEVLPGLDLSLVVDTSRAQIPNHGTPTAMLLARNRPPTTQTVRAVISRRAEPTVLQLPQTGEMWQGILCGAEDSSFENEFIFVRDLERNSLSRHPWTIGDEIRASIVDKLTAQPHVKLGVAARELGRTTACGHDPVYILPWHAIRTLHADSLSLPFVDGAAVRDWAVSPTVAAIYPYQSLGGAAVEPSDSRLPTFMWRYRSLLGSRTMFGKTISEHGKQWFEHLEHYGDRIKSKTKIAFANIATHNHFALTTTPALFNSKAPVIVLKKEWDSLSSAIAALLNSSLACYWMKDRFQPRGATSANRNHPDPERAAYEISVTGMKQFPLVETCVRDERLAAWGSELVRLSGERQQVLAPQSWLTNTISSESISRGLDERWHAHDKIRQRQIFVQEEIDWLVYGLCGLTRRLLCSPPGGIQMLPRGQRAFERLLGHRSFVRQRGALLPPETAECETGSFALPHEYAATTSEREREISENDFVSKIESYMFKRLWRDTEDNTPEATFRKQLDTEQIREALTARIEAAASRRDSMFTANRLAVDLMDNQQIQALAEVYAASKSFDLDALVFSILVAASIPSHPAHTYTDTGIAKRAVWESVWEMQSASDNQGTPMQVPQLPTFSQGSRGQSKDFLRNEYWRLRGTFDVEAERFIAFTEVPGRSGAETLYGWAGWTPVQRLRAILAIDENLEDADVPLADRIGLLDSAWRLLPNVAREDPGAAARLKAELQALVGPKGPSPELIEDWRKRFPPPSTRSAGARKASTKGEVDDSFDDLPTVIPDFSDRESAAFFIWALLYASGGTATRMDLARAFALRARPNLLKRLAPASLKREAAHWASTIGSRSVKAGLLALTLGELVDRNGVLLGIDGQSRATVSTSAHTCSEDQIDPWFRFEADLAIKVLRAQPEEKFSAIDKSLSGADRKLLESAA